MKINFKLKNFIVFITSLILLNIILFSIFLIIEKDFFDETAKLVGALVQNEKNDKKQMLEEKIFQIIKEENEFYTEKGKELFKKYSYSAEGLIFKKHKILIFMICLSLSLLFMLCVYIFVFIFKKEEEKNLAYSISLIQNIKKENYKIDLKEAENAFSHLNNEIYKTLILFNETKKLALDEKQSFKENLENIAHQLKIPISSMQIMLELFEDEYPNLYLELSNEKYFTKIKSQLQRLEGLTETLLKFSKLDSGNIRMKEDDFLLEECIAYSLETIEDELNSKNIFPDLTDIKLNSLKIKGDFYWIAEAFLNILKNFSNMHPNLTKIEIVARKNSVFTEVRLKNNGKKLVKEDLSKIFKRFYKINESKGFGIGLAMSKAILEQNNADIIVENTESGVAFIIKFYNI